MRQRLAMIVLSMLLRCAAAAQGAEQLIFWAAEQPVFVRLSLEVEGQSHVAAWTAAAGRLFDAFDRNGDGTLNNEEDLPGLLALVSLELVSDPGVVRGTEAAPLTLRRDALAALLAGRGIGPFCIVATAMPPINGTGGPRAVANDVLFAVLDEDRSGNLSADELTLSRRRKVDFDDDECLSVRDLLAARLFAAEDLSALQASTSRMSQASAGPASRLTRIALPRLTARELLTRYDDNRDGLLAIAELGLKPEAAADFDQDRNACLDLAETEQMLRRPPATVTLECRWPQRNTTPRTIALGDQTAVVELLPASPAFERDVVLQLFSDADRDRNHYLESAEADGLPPLKRAFRVIDRNADGKIFAAELLDYAQRVALIAPCQVVAIFQTQSRNVFETIDNNRDGKLSPVELDAFAARSGAGVSPMARLTLGPAATWTLGPTAALAQQQLRQPLWFTRMDRNQDGVVTQREFLGPSRSFPDLDTSGDGFLDAKEAAADAYSK